MESKYFIDKNKNLLEINIIKATDKEPEKILIKKTGFKVYSVECYIASETNNKIFFYNRDTNIIQVVSKKDYRLLYQTIEYYNEIIAYDDDTIIATIEDDERCFCHLLDKNTLKVKQSNEPYESKVIDGILYIKNSVYIRINTNITNIFKTKEGFCLVISQSLVFFDYKLEYLFTKNIPTSIHLSPVQFFYQLNLRDDIMIVSSVFSFCFNLLIGVKTSEINITKTATVNKETIDFHILVKDNYDSFYMINIDKKTVRKLNNDEMIK